MDVKVRKMGREVGLATAKPVLFELEHIGGPTDPDPT